MKILITGNLGYIGTVCSEIFSEKYDVTGLDNGLYEDSYLKEPFKLKKQIPKLSGIHDLGRCLGVQVTKSGCKQRRKQTPT